MSDLPELEFAQRVEGSLAVVPHPQEPELYGRGNLEVEGTLRINDVKSNKDDVIILHDPLDLSLVARDPQKAVQSGTLRIFADQTTGKLATRNESGQVTVLNPTDTIGDLIVYGSTGPERLPKGTIGQVLSIDSTGSVKWSAINSKTGSGGSVYGSNMMYDQDASEQIATNRVFVSRMRLPNVAYTTGMYVFNVSFDWNMVDASSTLEVQVLMNGETLFADSYYVHQVDEYRHVTWTKIIQKSTDTPLTFDLQMRCKEAKSAYKSKNVYMEVYQVGI